MVRRGHSVRRIPRHLVGERDRRDGLAPGPGRNGWAQAAHRHLTIKGRTYPVTVHGRSNGNGLLRGWAAVTQSIWGIKPYTAFLGALRLADEVMSSSTWPGSNQQTRTHER